MATNTAVFLYSTGVPFVFQGFQMPSPLVVCRKFYLVSLRMQSKAAQRKQAKPKKYQMVEFQSEIRLFFLKTRTLKQRINVLGSKRGLQLIEVIHSPTNINFFDMEQFVLVPVAVHNNKYIITQSDKMQEVPKNHTEQNSMYKSDSLEKEVNRKLFNKADFLVDIFLFCPRIKIPSSHTLITDGVETEVLLSVFAQHLHRKNTYSPDVHYILLDPAEKPQSGYESECNKPK